MPRAPYAPKKKRVGCDPDDWNTPPVERAFVRRVWGTPDLDPCAKSGRQNFGRDYFTPRARRPARLLCPRSENPFEKERPTHGGLAHIWRGFVFLNPPYSSIEDWMAHAVEQATRQEKPAQVLALVPVRTGRLWWQEYATRATATWFVPGRIRFWDPSLKKIGTAPTFDSAYLLFDPFARALDGFIRECAARCGGVDRVARPSGQRRAATRKAA